MAAGGLAPSQSSTITVLYRPCPAVWAGDMLMPNPMLQSCSGGADTVVLHIIDNTRKMGIDVTLSGQGAQAPSLELGCPMWMGGAVACNNTMPTFQMPCVTLEFGMVNAGGTPCDMTLEIRNNQRMNKATGPLNIERIEILASEIDEMITKDGTMVGFSFLNEDGTALNLDPAHPLTIEIPPGQAQGSKRIKVRYDGSVACTTMQQSCSGIWHGEADKMTGFRIYSDDPDHRPFEVWSIDGTATAPHIDVTPSAVNFGNVAQGASKTATLTVVNSGNADLHITQLKFMNDTAMATFKVSHMAGMPSMPFQQFTVPMSSMTSLYVTYAPTASGNAADKLLIGSDDTSQPVFPVAVAGGAEPRLVVNPSDELTFPTTQSGMPVSETVQIRNVGFADLTIMQLDIQGVPGSKEDFTINGCSSYPCMPATTLCSPSAPGCTNSSKTFTLVYQNHDISTTDYAQLVVSTNDPNDPMHIIVLKADDVPCFYPTPIIDVKTMAPHCNMPVMLDGTNSQPGGSPMMPATISGYTWSIVFSAEPNPPTFNPQGAAMTQFTPTTGGVYIVGLDVVNSCNAQSQNQQQEMVTVQCP
jgi:hypothetical protein